MSHAGAARRSAHSLGLMGRQIAVAMEHEDACRAALAAYADGMGFADAMHAASATAMSIQVHTSDAGLAGKAERLLGISVQLV